MSITQRGHSVNTYCLSKLWFKTASVDLRSLDIAKITSQIKSWIYADQLEKPQEMVLYRSRKQGGLGKASKKNLIGIFQLGSRPPPPPPIGKKNLKKYFICLFHVSEHFKATFFYFFSQLENDPSLTPLIGKFQLDFFF